jgi:hypothetical protein
MEYENKEKWHSYASTLPFDYMKTVEEALNMYRDDDYFIYKNAIREFYKLPKNKWKKLSKRLLQEIHSDEDVSVILQSFSDVLTSEFRLADIKFFKVEKKKRSGKQKAAYRKCCDIRMMWNSVSRLKKDADEVARAFGKAFSNAYAVHKQNDDKEAKKCFNSLSVADIKRMVKRVQNTDRELFERGREAYIDEKVRNQSA